MSHPTVVSSNKLLVLSSWLWHASNECRRYFWEQ